MVKIFHTWIRRLTDWMVLSLYPTRWTLCFRNSLIHNTAWCHTDDIFISNKVEYRSREGKELQVFYQRCYIVILSDLCNAVKKILGKISWHTTYYFTTPVSRFRVLYINVHVRNKVSKKLHLRIPLFSSHNFNFLQKLNDLHLLSSWHIMI